MNGVIYYNSGRKMIVRLAVSLHTLRKVYSGPVTILIDNDGKEECKELAKLYNCDIIEANYEYNQSNSVYLNACRSGELTPYDITIWIDSDTIILKSFDELFNFANIHEFAIAQFSSWTTMGRSIKKRILAWKGIYPELMDAAVNFGPAINCGVFSFRKDSRLVQDWYSLAEKGNINFIPDEVCCQIMLHKYPHIIVDPVYNTSCKYGTITDDTRIIHFHGKKHCRIEKGSFECNSNLWYKYFEEVRSLKLVTDNIRHDRMLRHNIEKYEKLKNEKL